MQTKGDKGEWRYMATLARSQRGMLTASLVTLVLAAMCEVAVPHYSSRALNAAVFAQNRKVSYPRTSCMCYPALRDSEFTLHYGTDTDL